ncbi:MAG: hypothetical protein HY532_08345 [Chloroflexi bacterium]|nr:hypothetical protein [Chloroflexota bacterium]
MLAAVPLFWLWGSTTVSANGFLATEIYQGRQGPYVLTARAIAPQVVRGNVHLSLVLQDAATQRLVSSVPVLVQARGPEGDMPGPVAAYHELSTPQYYDVDLRMETLGMWQVDVIVQGPEGETQFTFPLQVEEPVVSWSAISGMLVLVLLLLPLAFMGLRVLRRGKEKS